MTHRDQLHEATNQAMWSVLLVAPTEPGRRTTWRALGGVVAQAPGIQAPQLCSMVGVSNCQSFCLKCVFCQWSW